MLLLTILLNLFIPQPTANDVTVEFTFKEMKLGKPTLQYFYYDVTIKNTSASSKYVVLPRWFDKSIPSSAIVTGKQYNSFGTSKGAILFADNSIAIFIVPANGEIKLENYELDTFTEYFDKKGNVDVPVVVCNNVLIGDYSLQDFMQKTGCDPLEYKLENPSNMTVVVKLK